MDTNGLPAPHHEGVIQQRALPVVAGHRISTWLMKLHSLDASPLSESDKLEQREHLLCSLHADPIAFLSKYIKQIPPGLASEFAGILNAQERSGIVQIRDRRRRFFKHRTPEELSVEESRARWPLLWKRTVGRVQMGAAVDGATHAAVASGSATLPHVANDSVSDSNAKGKERVVARRSASPRTVQAKLDLRDDPSEARSTFDPKRVVPPSEVAIQPRFERLQRDIDESEVLAKIARLEQEERETVPEEEEEEEEEDDASDVGGEEEPSGVKASATGETTEDALQIERERLEVFMAEVEKRFVSGDLLIPKYLYDDCDFDDEWDRHERDKDERGANAVPARDSEERWFDEEEESSPPTTKSDTRYSPDF